MEENGRLSRTDGDSLHKDGNDRKGTGKISFPFKSRLNASEYPISILFQGTLIFFIAFGITYGWKSINNCQSFGNVFSNPLMHP
jgi:hypothetical protein